MKNKFCISLIICAFALFGLDGCKKDKGGSSECNIVKFTVGGEEWQIGADNTISYIYPKGTSGRLVANIVVSPGATVSPADGSAQDFFVDDGVTYTVTAENGTTTKTYVARATAAAQ
ncbi:MAG: DUF5018 domain-containing protein [Bacteroidales bacterium]|jgi:hypothetical protein|nr:DUF5018 domain-containing protein [Bacteroidales bacterium]